MTTDYKFTYQTDDELMAAQRTGYIDSYDIVRMHRKVGNGSIDHPCKSRESYEKCLELFQDDIIEVYPNTHSYDIYDYL